MSATGASRPSPGGGVETETFARTFAALEGELRKVMVGQADLLRDTLLAMIAGGHVLLEGVPGLGKTVLVRTIGQALSLQFSRVQFTPDLMPADIVGTNIIQDIDGSRQLSYQAGPIFSNIVLADEINRATPKTQSALLEAMQEHSVTVGIETRLLPEPFFVLATQNPIELEGTYPLPEAQLDRFLFKVLVPFPPEADLEEIVRRTTGDNTPQPSTVADAATLVEMMALARQVPIADHVASYAVRLVGATHPDRSASPDVRRFVRFGASPRGVQALVLAAKVRALVDGRYNVAFDDLRAVALPALRHRLILNFEADAAGKTSDMLVQELLETVVTDPSAV
jgi:MoxR-like ATPase